MDARKTQLFKVLDGRKQFTIPIYQRTYSWTTDQCKQLWEDIVKVSKDDENIRMYSTIILLSIILSFRLFIEYIY